MHTEQLKLDFSQQASNLGRSIEVPLLFKLPFSVLFSWDANGMPSKIPQIRINQKLAKTAEAALRL